MKYFYLFIIVFLFIQCDNSLDIEEETVQGLAPIYTNIEIGDLVSEDTIDYAIIGQVEYYEDYLLIIEQELGVHVIDNSDLSNPTKIYFLRLPGVTHVIPTDGFLIASLANHILTIDIQDFQTSYITSIIDQPSPNGIGSFPSEDFNGKFECVDLSKGIVSGWEMKLLVNPQCNI